MRAPVPPDQPRPGAEQQHAERQHAVAPAQGPENALQQDIGAVPHVADLLPAEPRREELIEEKERKGEHHAVTRLARGAPVAAGGGGHPEGYSVNGEDGKTERRKDGSWAPPDNFPSFRPSVSHR